MSVPQQGRISPPPLKRRRRGSPIHVRTQSTAARSAAELSDPASRIRIVSWNINGITPFVRPYLQRTLHSFFGPASKSPASPRKRQRSPEASDQEDDDDESKSVDDLTKEGRASLRDTLRRYHWPQVLFLQEVKIKPGDQKTMNTVRTAINDDASSQHSSMATGISGRLSNDCNSRQTTSTETTTKCRLLTDGGPRYEADFVLPSDPHNGTGFGGKVYGVAAIVREDFMRGGVECIREPDWDREGRFQIIETNEIPIIRDNISSSEAAADHAPSASSPPIALKLAIINVYAVNGTFNPYKSAHTGKHIGTRHDRKLAVHTELLRESLVLESRGFHVVIAGDLNIARARIDGFPNLRTTPHQHVLNREDFNRKFFTGDKISEDLPSVRAAFYDHAKLLEDQKHKNGGRAVEQVTARGLNGVDTFRHIHGDERRYSWHSMTKDWGTCCDRVDLILASRSLADNIMDAGICDNPRDRGPSDHCPIWVDIG